MRGTRRAASPENEIINYHPLLHAGTRLQGGPLASFGEAAVVWCWKQKAFVLSDWKSPHPEECLRMYAVLLSLLQPFPDLCAVPDTFRGHESIRMLTATSCCPHDVVWRGLWRGRLVDWDGGREEVLPPGGQVLQRAVLEVNPLLHSKLLLWGRWYLQGITRCSLNIDFCGERRGERNLERGYRSPNVDAPSSLNLLRAQARSVLHLSKENVKYSICWCKCETCWWRFGFNVLHLCDANPQEGKSSTKRSSQKRQSPVFYQSWHGCG